MAIRWLEKTGFPNLILPSLRAALGQHARRHDEIKIGLTVNPEARWNAHKQENWKEMVVIYETSSPRFASNIERDLIKHGWDFHYDKSWNEITGGGSLQHGHLRYYVYVLLS